MEPIVKQGYCFNVGKTDSPRYNCYYHFLLLCYHRFLFWTGVLMRLYYNDFVLMYQKTLINQLHCRDILGSNETVTFGNQRKTRRILISLHHCQNKLILSKMYSFLSLKKTTIKQKKIGKKQQKIKNNLRLTRILISWNYKRWASLFSSLIKTFFPMWD